MKTINITIKGLPPSLNQLYKFTQGRVYMTTEGKDFKTKVENYLMLDYKIKKVWVRPSKNEFKLTITYYLNGEMDLDNLQKVLLDSMEHLTYLNDEQIIEITTIKKYDPTTPRIELTITETDKGYDLKTLTGEEQI